MKDISVLLVDDDLDAPLIDTEVVRFKLNRVQHVKDAIEALNYNSTDVVILGNISAEKLIQLIQEIRTKPGDPAIVVVSNNPCPQLAIEAVEEGAQDFLVKQDIGNGTLARVVAYAATRRESQRKSARHKIGLDTVTVSRGNLDALRALDEMIGEEGALDATR